MTVLGMAVGLNLLLPPSVKQAREVSSVVNDADGRLLSSFTVDNGTWRLPADLQVTDPRFTARLIAIEDKRFYHHSGVDFPAVIRAMRSWHRQGQAVSGASTITMQLVRQLEPRPRTLPSKFIEMIRALQIELWMNKDEILEAYLTHVSYGGNIEGIEAAARLYFGKSPEYLTDGEIALLISLPQAPEARRPDRRPKAAKAGRDIIIDKLRIANIMTEGAAAEAKASPLTFHRGAMADVAWITANSLAREKTGVIETTIKADLQISLESMVKTFVSDLPDSVNTAVTVVENKTMAVRAHIASADRARPGGWIDMTTRSRSPGSTLKPFIYGFAIDDGLVSSSSVAFDAPTRFGTYRPENFNRRYHGNVRVHEALRHSLNVPAVAALELVGGARFEQSLTAAGANVSRLGSGSDKAGLALALGGVGMSVNDVALLYAALANGGAAYPLRWAENDVQIEKGFPLLGRDSAAEITRILAQAPTPDGRMPSWLREGGTSIAYKTGTSYGFRDAWAAGYTDDYTVVVWIGRPDGAPRMGVTGRLAAAPLLFDIFETLPSRASSTVYHRDDDAPEGIQTLGQKQSGAPHILFPPNDAEIYTDKVGPNSRGFTVSARVEGRDYAAYINGELIAKTGRHHVWRPEQAGFYTLTVIDEVGRQASSNVRVLSSSSLSARSTGFDQSANAPL